MTWLAGLLAARYRLFSAGGDERGHTETEDMRLGRTSAAVAFARGGFLVKWTVEPLKVLVDITFELDGMGAREATWAVYDLNKSATSGRSSSGTSIHD